MHCKIAIFAKRRALIILTSAFVFLATLCFINRENDQFFVNFFGNSFESPSGVNIDTPAGTNILTVSGYKDEVTPVSLKHLTFEKGAYSFDFQYDTINDDIRFYIRSVNYLHQDNTNETVFFEQYIDLNNTYISSEFVLDQNVNDAEVLILLPPGASLSIGRITFSSNSVYSNDSYVILAFFTLCYILFTYVLLSNKQFCKPMDFLGSTPSGKRVFFALSFVFISLSFYIIYPMLHETFFGGHDLIYHLNRIEGIKTALLSGQFPVRIHPEQLAGYGYPNGIFYPELFLYFPALLRILGMSVKNSYITFIFTVNITTALFSYLSFTQLFRSRYAGILCAVVYTLNPYRLANLYERSALGEFIAATFFPVVLYGLYCIIFEDKKRWHWLVLGASGLLQSHILSTELALLFCIFTCLLFLKRLFDKEKRFLSLIKAGTYSLLINLWFILPFLIMSVQKDIAVFNMSPLLSIKAIKDIDELFSIGVLSNYREAINGVAASGIGVTFLIATIMFCIYAILKYKRDCSNTKFFELGIFSTVSVLFFTLATTELFPYDEIQRIPIVGDIIGAIQIPNRLITFVMVFATVLVGICLILYTKKGKQRLFTTIAIVIFSTVMSWIYLNGVAVQPFHQDFGNSSQTNLFQSSGLSIALGEYIPGNSNISDALTRGTNIKTDHNITFSQVERYGTEMEFNYVINDFDENHEYKVILPMISYPKYVANINDQEYDTTAGGYNYVEITLPEKQGHVSVGYQQPTVFLFANIISLFSAIALFIVFWYHKKCVQLQLKFIGKKTFEDKLSETPTILHTDDTK